MKLFTVASLALLCYLCQGAAWDTTSFTVSQSGNSANWFITNKNDSTTLHLRIDDLQETAERKFQWQSSSDVNVTNATKTLNNTDANATTTVQQILYACTDCAIGSGNDTFNFSGSLEVLLFNETGTWDMGLDHSGHSHSHKVEVAGEVKLTLEVTKWTFENVNNTLTQSLYAKLESEQQLMSYERMLKTDSLGTFVLSLPEKAEIDGTSTDITVSQTGESSNYDIVLPHFTTSAWYDPTVVANNTAPEPPVEDYYTAETTTLKVDYWKTKPQFSLYDTNTKVKKHLSIVVGQMSESNTTLSMDWSTATLVVTEATETAVLCDGGGKTLKVQMLSYNCLLCATTKTGVTFTGTIRGYLVNETAKDCVFGGVANYKVDLKAGDFKLDLNLQSWPWENSNDTLQLTVVTTEVDNESNYVLGRQVNDLSSYGASWAEEYVVYSGLNTTKTTDTKVDIVNNTVTVSLGYFNTTEGQQLYYDPIFYRTGSASYLSLIFLALFFIL